MPKMFVYYLNFSCSEQQNHHRHSHTEREVRVLFKSPQLCYGWIKNSSSQGFWLFFFRFSCFNFASNAAHILRVITISPLSGPDFVRTKQWFFTSTHTYRMLLTFTHRSIFFSLSVQSTIGSQRTCVYLCVEPG